MSFITPPKIQMNTGPKIPIKKGEERRKKRGALGTEGNPYEIDDDDDEKSLTKTPQIQPKKTEKLVCSDCDNYTTALKCTYPGCNRITCIDHGIAQGGIFVHDVDDDLVEHKWVLCSAHKYKCKVCDDEMEIGKLKPCQGCEKYYCKEWCGMMCENEECERLNLFGELCNNCLKECTGCEKQFCRESCIGPRPDDLCPKCFDSK